MGSINERYRMHIEAYFDFVSPEEIQIKGHRIWIENILYEYLHNAMSPDELADRFPTLTMEQILATLLYYHQHKAELDQYLADWLEYSHRMWREQQANPTPDMIRLRKLKAAREAQRRQQEQVELA